MNTTRCIDVRCARVYAHRVLAKRSTVLLCYCFCIDYAEPNTLHLRVDPPRRSAICLDYPVDFTVTLFKGDKGILELNLARTCSFNSTHERGGTLKLCSYGVNYDSVSRTDRHG